MLDLRFRESTSNSQSTHPFRIHGRFPPFFRESLPLNDAETYRRTVLSSNVGLHDGYENDTTIAVESRQFSPLPFRVAWETASLSVLGHAHSTLSVSFDVFSSVSYQQHTPELPLHFTTDRTLKYIAK